MIDATILIPTYRHAALLPFAVRSALDQADASVEVFVVGDGVEDDTRAALEPFAGDDRVRFFDLPKGPRHGELNRHEALREATGKIVCYLSDDDLLLPGHVSEMRALLENADLAHSPHFWIDLDGTLNFLPRNMGRAEFVELARSGTESIGLSGAAHTLDGYRRLPHGWRTTPADEHTDHHMWLQWLGIPGFRGVAGARGDVSVVPLDRLGEDRPERARRDARGLVSPVARAGVRRRVRRADPSRGAPLRRGREPSCSGGEACAGGSARHAHVAASPASRQCAAAASAARQASRSALSGPSSRSRSEISGAEQGHAISSAGSSQRQPSSSAGSHSWLTA